MPAIVTARMRWLGLVVLLAGAILPPIDFFIVNVALSSIRESLHTSPAETQLVISGYAAGYAVFLITGGRLGDLYGRRLLYILGMTGFGLANLLCGLAQTPTQLLIGRVVIGIAAAMLQPQTLATMRAMYTGERELARAMSLYGTMVGLAAAVGASTIEPAAAAAISGAIKRAAIFMVGTFFVVGGPSGFHRSDLVPTTLPIRELEIMNCIT